MGVAVDDTIHFLTWFRRAIRDGLDRRAAIKAAYGRVSVAMTQTTLISGLGLSVFALSTFTPTQRFGIMMLTLLVAALIGDLILLPALLAGPLGRYVCPKDVPSLPPAGQAEEPGSRPRSAVHAAGSAAAAAMHTARREDRSASSLLVRRDSSHT
jgi:multidrug efflux pump subunit AcrB